MKKSFASLEKALDIMSFFDLDLLAFQSNEFIADYVKHKDLEKLTGNTISDPDSLV